MRTSGDSFWWSNPMEKPKHAGVTKSVPPKVKAKAAFKGQKASRRKNRK